MSSCSLWIDSGSMHKSETNVCHCQTIICNPAKSSSKVACKYFWGVSTPERSTDNCRLLEDTSKLPQQIERKVEGPWLYVKYIFFSITDLVRVSVSCGKTGKGEVSCVYFTYSCLGQSHTPHPLPLKSKEDWACLLSLILVQQQRSSPTGLYKLMP